MKFTRKAINIFSPLLKHVATLPLEFYICCKSGRECKQNVLAAKGIFEKNILCGVFIRSRGAEYRIFVRHAKKSHYLLTNHKTKWRQKIYQVSQISRPLSLISLSFVKP